MPLTPGTILGQYEIRSPLGAGGMGEVYRAHDTRLDREVAIKVLPESLTADPDRLRRFEQEARAAAALNHPNILAVYQMATHEGVSYMVSELLEGETLRERLRRGPIPLRKAIDYGVQIAHGLAAAHDKGIVHRDLKPENLFVTKDGRVKILDFGLAKLTQPKDDSGQMNTLTQGTDPGMVVGTAGYMSPEQVRGKAADHRSDIFAFGTILYETVTGKQTFRKPTSAETMSAILNEEPQAISQLTPSVPPGLERVVRRCLEKAPEQRFQSASDLAFALEALSDSAITSPTGIHAQEGSNPKRRIAVAGAVVVIVLAARRWLTSGCSLLRCLCSLITSSLPMTVSRKAWAQLMARASTCIGVPPITRVWPKYRFRAGIPRNYLSCLRRTCFPADCRQTGRNYWWWTRMAFLQWGSSGVCRS